MKKQFGKDIKNRKSYKTSELNNFISKQISENFNFVKAIQWNARHKVISSPAGNSRVKFQNRCIQTINKKIFHKFSPYSRMLFYKIAKLGQISGLRKAYW